jgi:hypothetical protein
MWRWKLGCVIQIAARVQPKADGSTNKVRDQRLFQLSVCSWHSVELLI